MSANANGHLLLTGATGFVGMEVLARYLERGDRHVVALVRARDDAAAATRMATILHELFGARAGRYAGRVAAVAGDLTAPDLGLSPRHRAAVAEHVDEVIHCGASVSFSASLAEARAVNLDGTRRMLDVAAACDGLRRFAYVSTAYVAGTHDGAFLESDLDVGQGFRNGYEQSKFEAEQVLRAHGNLPLTVLRPSIVVGDRRSGWTSAFNVLYWPLRAFSRGLFPAVPALPSATVDVVSVDYVADAIHALCTGSDGIGATYHLTAGTHATSVGELTTLASRYFDRPPPQVLSPEEFAAAARLATQLQRAVLAQGAVYFPYFAIRTRFDDTAARRRLEPRGIRPSPLGDYLERLLDFATRTDWGKRRMSRVDALAA